MLFFFQMVVQPNTSHLQSHRTKELAMLLTQHGLFDVSAAFVDGMSFRKLIANELRFEN